jgi:hypothetical protein
MEPEGLRAFRMGDKFMSGDEAHGPAARSIMSDLLASLLP